MPDLGLAAPPRPTEVLVAVVEDWLRRLACDGGPPPGARVRAVLAGLALAAPHLAARCPALLAMVGPSVAYCVKVQASVPAVSGAALAAADGARWITTAQAAAALGIRACLVDLGRRFG